MARSEALEAVAFGIDDLKKSVPVRDLPVLARDALKSRDALQILSRTPSLPFADTHAHRL